MIPIQLTLRNFLSYREATLDFRGLQMACICGPNGAGKSSLLEAISWAIWGASRAASEDDVIHLGTQEARVDFIFSIHSHTYRIIRTRTLRQGMILEFQIASSSTVSPPAQQQFRSLTAKGVRATQQLILQHLNLDYETFINSAYLRQGRADEFMLKRPGERKQILADLLKLQHYDLLADRARDRARQLKGQLEVLDKQRTLLKTQHCSPDDLTQAYTAVEDTISHLQQLQATGREQLQVWQTQQQQRYGWQQQLQWQHQQAQALQAERQRLQTELAKVEQHYQSLDALVQQEADIVVGYAQWQHLQGQEELFTNRWQAYQTLQQQRQEYQQEQSDRRQTWQQQWQQAQLQAQTLQEQLQEQRPILEQAADVAAGLEHLRTAREQLQHYEQVQLQASPLLQRRQHLQHELNHRADRLSRRLDELRRQVQHLQNQQQRSQQVQQAATHLSQRLEDLDQLRRYQEQVREKGLERRSFMERLQAHQRAYETQLAEVEQLIRLLRPAARVLAPVTGLEHDGPLFSLLLTAREPVGNYAIEPRPSLQPDPEVGSSPICPLCDRALDEHHWHVVMQKHEAKQQDILDQIWVIREQLAVSEREIQVLRQEYCQIQDQLSQYGSMMHKQGQLQEQLLATVTAHQTLMDLTQQLAQVEQQLRQGDYATEVQTELQLLEQTLTTLNYDERDHALARGQVDRWRWAEAKHHAIQQAQKRYDQLLQKQPQLAAQIEHLEAQMAHLDSEATTQLAQFDADLAAIDYSLEQHNALRASLRQAQGWQLKYQELQQARQRLPQVQQRLDELTQHLQATDQQQQAIDQQVAGLQRCLADTPDPAEQMHAIEQQIQQARQDLDQQLAERGRLQQQIQHQADLSCQQATLEADYQQVQQQHRIYQELAQAFGKNGIPALIIENVLPQLETMANQILSRLTRNQLHVKFVTQRLRSSKSKAQPSKASDTLDILLCDAHGTRPYETYSGGEAFRINFAIRLALARLLSQRSGTALQLLIVDEGFGTQDQEGCDRLIAAINAIASDFACILTITHMPAFRDAFPARIEVSKTEAGSQIRLCV
jgi:exonuclease SbcC